jgi:hypothetical protein
MLRLSFRDLRHALRYMPEDQLDNPAKIVCGHTHFQVIATKCVAIKEANSRLAAGEIIIKGETYDMGGD